MSNEITVAPAQNLIITDDKVALLKRTIGNADMTDDELQLFVSVCNRTRLDPFLKQIYAIPRWNPDARRMVTTYQIGIDGFRLLSERSGQYRGQVGPFWCGKDGEWKDVWLSDDPPVAAKVGILREGFEQPQWGVAKFNSYVQRKKDGTITRMWLEKPEVLIAKCAEAIARRITFAQEFCGLYLHEEMQQADNPAPPQPEPKPAPAQFKQLQPPDVPMDLYPNIGRPGWDAQTIHPSHLPLSLRGTELSYVVLATEPTPWTSKDGKLYQGRQLVHMWAGGKDPALAEVATALLALYPSKKDEPEAEPEPQPAAESEAQQ